MKNLPTSISNLTRLEILLIQECPLQDMPCIEALTELHTLDLAVSDYDSDELAVSDYDSSSKSWRRPS